MKAAILIIIGCWLMAGSLQAQNHVPLKYTNHTEFGGLFGRVKYQFPGSPGDEILENRLNVTLQTFNGVMLSNRLSAGVTAGIDWYKTALLAPISGGIRYDLTKNGGVRLFTTADVGYGFAWFQDDIEGYRTKGGLMLNPGLGLRMGKAGGPAVTFTVSYKRQEAHIDKFPLWDQVERSEDRVYNRLALRLGISF
ncbi:hypothetical protein [Dyadobacter psychrophilus]|uniref:Outer membrane protein beta-barrel domain-containing protein n=1 Tax=Dyadobacter psychrophilus TaxID=651661 RepID=A0A1T5GRH5_9BACT|nr:hypothetical protein [Dyadobacter psychrophilus]SKC10968.1 hypothetical protein SAMN05660293_04326 [Dyadobacter psychrophilus]